MKQTNNEIREKIQVIIESNFTTVGVLERPTKSSDQQVGYLNGPKVSKELINLYTETVKEELRKCIDIAENGDYTMFIKNDLHSIMALGEATAIRKQARKEVADKIKEYLFKCSLPTEE